VGAVLLLAAVWVLHRELREVRYREVVASLRALPPLRVLLAFLVTALNYVILTGFDLLAFEYIGKRVHGWKVALASFTGYAVSNSVGFALISGTSVRYRFYSRWGLTSGELSQVVLFYFGTFWLGLLVLGGWSLAFDPHPALTALPGGVLVRPAGALLLLVAAGYAAAAALRRAPLRVGPLTIPFPPLRLVAGQFVLSMADWALATGIFYFLLPPSELSFGEVLSAFLAGQILGLLSHVPGGLGVFEGTVMLMLRPHLPAEQIVSALVLYRVFYYLIPLGAALVILVADEVRQRRHHLARLGGAFGALTRQLAPKVLAVFTFLSGALLLFSGATPTVQGRITWLNAWVPLAVTEASHFLASVVGVGLLVASHGIARRLDASYYFAAGGLAVGIAASLLKGADYEEALLLAGVLAALVPSRAEFDRRAAFFAARFSPGWIAAVLAVVGASIWLGFFAYAHVEYSDDLWWEFAVDRSAPRFLRASMGATMAVLAFGVLRLLRPAPAEVALPTEAELAAAEAVIARQTSTVPYLAYLRDKTLLFNEARDTFLMYAVQGKSWVAMGDPVGPPSGAPEVIRAFLGRCDDFGGDPVFYQVARDRLHLYADFGLTFAKLGEEAYVPLDGFSLEGAANKPFRLVLNRFARSGAEFRVVPPEEVPALLPELRSVSDEWLRSKGASEKGFSLGFFDPDTLRRFPVAVVREEGRVTAFASVWPGPGGEELSVDLMRYRASAQRDVMEALLLHLVLWGKERGFRRFSLGMAPLSGLEVSAVSPVWTRLGHFLYQQGGVLYNFQGLRAYKEKFHPVWEPRYLAHPGGLALARILADVSALVAGGYRRIFR
jgi:phosphatidylglycerol lysyltransferase